MLGKSEGDDSVFVNGEILDLADLFGAVHIVGGDRHMIFKIAHGIFDLAPDGKGISAGSLFHAGDDISERLNFRSFLIEADANAVFINGNIIHSAVNNDGVFHHIGTVDDKRTVSDRSGINDAAGKIHIVDAQRSLDRNAVSGHTVPAEAEVSGSSNIAFNTDAGVIRKNGSRLGNQDISCNGGIDSAGSGNGECTGVVHCACGKGGIRNSDRTGVGEVPVGHINYAVIGGIDNTLIVKVSGSQSGIIQIIGEFQRTVVDRQSILCAVAERYCSSGDLAAVENVNRAVAAGFLPGHTRISAAEVKLIMSNRNDTFAVFAVHDQMTVPAAVTGTDTSQFGSIAEFTQFHGTVNSDRTVVFNIAAICFENTSGVDDQLSRGIIHSPQIESLVAIIGSDSQINLAVDRDAAALIIGTGKSTIADNLDFGVFSENKVSAHVDKTVDHRITFAFGPDGDVLRRTKHAVRSIISVPGSKNDHIDSFGKDHEITPPLVICSGCIKFAEGVDTNNMSVNNSSDFSGICGIEIENILCRLVDRKVITGLKERVIRTIEDHG